MTAQLYVIYIFLSQFPALINIGSSYVGLQILILPLFYYFSNKVRKLSNYIFIVLGISFFVGFLKFRELNFLEFNLRIVSILTVVASLLIPLIIYKRIDDFVEFKKKFIRPLLLTSIPSLLFCFIELFFKFSKSLFFLNIIVGLKKYIFVPNRMRYTVGTLAGLFPEHGLFACYLLFIIGISFLFIDFRKMTKIHLLSISWVFLSVFHSSGLFFAALLITIFIFIILNILSFIKDLKFDKRIIIFSILGILLSGLLILVGPIYNPFLFKRFSLIFTNIYSTGFAIDPSLNYKLLPYYALFKTNIIDLFTGSGSSYFSNYIPTIIDYLPSHLIKQGDFLINLEDKRFSLNSTIICSLLEYGFFLYTAILIILKKYCKLFKPVDLFVNFSRILILNFETKKILSIFFLFASFITLLGAVPLTYPFPYISLAMIFIIFDDSLKSNVKAKQELFK